MNKRILALGLALAFTLTACESMPSWMGGGKKQEPPLPGERITVLPVEAELKPDESVAKLPVRLPPARLNADWPQRTGNVTSATSNLAGGSLEAQDSATAGSGEEFEHTLVTPPVVGGGMVFAMDAVGNVSAHDAADIGSVRWQSAALSEEDEPDIMGGGLAYDNGRLYGSSGRGRIVAWDAATGQELWHSDVRVPFRSAPRVAGGKLFATTIDSQTYAFNAANGQILWTHRGINETNDLMNSVSPALAGDTLIVPYASGEVYALSATDGRELWSDSLALNRQTAGGAFSGIGGDPVIDGEVVFAVSYSGLLSVLHLAQGRHVWEQPVASMNTPWVTGDFMYLLTSENTLVAFIKYDGRTRWSTRLPSFEDEEDKQGAIVWRGPVMVDGKLVLVGSRGQMQIISAADGSVVETRSIPDGIYTPPVVAGGRMYLVGQDARLYSLQ